MGEVIPFVSGFPLGQITDAPIDALPRGAAYELVNYLPQRDAVLRKRGIQKYASKDLTTVSSCQHVSQLGWARFSTGSELIAFCKATDNKSYKAFKITTFDGTNGTLLATGIFARTDGASINLDVDEMRAQPFYHQSAKLLIIPGFTHGPTPTGVNQALPLKYDGSTVALLGGTPPAANCGASWGDYLILANEWVAGKDRRNRIYFSDVGNAESWNANGFLDMPEEVLAVVPKGNLIFAFGPSGVHIITGDTPPPGGNLSVRKFAFGQGLADARSVCTWKENVIWANKDGIWKSDGASIRNLMDDCGNAAWYRWAVSQIGNDGSIPCTVYQGKLICSVRSGPTSSYAFPGYEVKSFVIDLEKNVLYQFSGIDSTVFLTVPAAADAAATAADEVFYGRYSVNGRAYKGAQMFNPPGVTAATNGQDEGGPTVDPYFITGFSRFGSAGYKRFRRAYLTYAFQDGGSAGLSIQFRTDPTKAFDQVATLSSAGSGLGPATGTLTQIRAARGINRKAEALQLKVGQGGPSGDTRIFSVEQEVEAYGKQRISDGHS